VLPKVLGSTIQLVDSVQALKDQAHKLLGEHNLLNQQPRPPEYRFYVTDVPLRFKEIGERFLGRALSDITVVKW